MNGASVWKWIAGMLAVAMLAGLPGYIQLYADSPSKHEFELLRERQDLVLQRLSAFDVRFSNVDNDRLQLESQIRDLQTLIRELQRG